MGLVFADTGGVAPPDLVTGKTSWLLFVLLSCFGKCLIYLLTSVACLFHPAGRRDGISLYARVAGRPGGGGAAAARRVWRRAESGGAAMVPRNLITEFSTM